MLYSPSTNLADELSDNRGITIASEEELEEIILTELQPKVICYSFLDKFNDAQADGKTGYFSDELILVSKDKNLFIRADIEAKNPEGVPFSDVHNAYGLKSGIILQPYEAFDQVALYSYQDDFWVLARVVDHSEIECQE